MELQLNDQGTWEDLNGVKENLEGVSEQRRFRCQQTFLACQEGIHALVRTLAGSGLREYAHHM